MQIIKSSREVREEKARENKAKLEMNMCPECGKKMSVTKGDGIIWTWMDPRGHFYFQRKCGTCGCEWRSESFK